MQYAQATVPQLPYYPGYAPSPVMSRAATGPPVSQTHVVEKQARPSAGRIFLIIFIVILIAGGVIFFIAGVSIKAGSKKTKKEITSNKKQTSTGNKDEKSMLKQQAKENASSKDKPSTKDLKGVKNPKAPAPAK